MSATSYGTNVPARSLPKGLAVASLILGIVGIFTSFLLFGALLGLVALILGFVALGKVKRGEADGRGLAIGGIITGVLAMLLTLLLVATVGTVLINNKDKISNYADCLNNANNDKQAQQACANEFNRQLNP